MIGAKAYFYGKYWAAWVYPDHVHTILYDGSETRGYPLSDSPTFRNDAAVAGYGDDTYWFMIEHDLLHSFLAEQIDNAPSASLWNQAHDPNAWRRKLDSETALGQAIARDEQRTYAVQAALNGVSWATERVKECGVLLYDYYRARDMVRAQQMDSVWARQEHQTLVLPLGWEAKRMGDDKGEAEYGKA